MRALVPMPLSSSSAISALWLSAPNRFFITAPLLAHAVNVDLPKAQSEANHTPAEAIQIGIAADAQIYWSGQPVNVDQPGEHMTGTTAADPRAELQLRADQPSPAASSRR